MGSNRAALSRDIGVDLKIHLDFDYRAYERPLDTPNRSQKLFHFFGEPQTSASPPHYYRTTTVKT